MPDRGEPHRPYFADLNAMLRRAEVASPALLVDLDHLEDNCRAVLTRVPEPSIGAVKFFQGRGSPLDLSKSRRTSSLTWLVNQRP